MRIHSARRRLRFQFEALEPRLPLATLMVTNTNDTGAGSLRQAILDANAAGGADVIAFDIPANDPRHFYYRDDGVADQVTLSHVTATTASDDSTIGNIDPDWRHSWWSIQPASQLPTIESQATINGYTQFGASENSLADGIDAVLRIELNGSSAGASTNGMRTSSGVTIRGLVINCFGAFGSANGVVIGFGDSCVVQGNFVGTDVSGTLDLGNGSAGVMVSGGGNFNSFNHTIGGTSPAARNLISGNDYMGVNLTSNFNDSNVVQGNFIGTDRNGTRALGNGNGDENSRGIGMFNSRFSVIGGTTPEARNVIAGNNGVGIHLGAAATDGTKNNLVQGNFIGVGADGITPLGNSRQGVLVAGGAGLASPFDNTIGGAAVGAGNIIAHNGLDGVAVGLSDRNAILGNSIFANGRLGIDLFGNVGVTPNDTGDTDAGANNLQNFPVLRSVETNGSQTTIHGTLDSTPGGTFTVQFFANDMPDPSGQGEGQFLLGTATVTPDAAGNFTTVLTTSVGANQFVTATATDTNNNTSEFSAALGVRGSSTAAIFTVINTLDSGTGSLRAAILSANGAPNAGGVPDEIHFNIPAADTGHVYYRDDGVAGQVHPFNITPTTAADDGSIADIDPDWPHSWYSIQPATRLPIVNSPVIIDGFTQPGARANTNTVESRLGLNTVLRIELDGSTANSAMDHAPGLEVYSGGEGSTIRGLLVNRFWTGIYVAGERNRVEGNFIGTDVSGTHRLGGRTPLGVVSQAWGVDINPSFGPAAFNVIGGTSAAARNLITGHGRGIEISGNHNNVQGNLIGTDRTGTVGLGNNAGGVVITFGSTIGNVIGGDAAGAGNVIAANDSVPMPFLGSGISLRNTTNTVVQGNFIGTDVTGTRALGNASFGVSDHGSNGTRIGGPSAPARNVISGNERDDFGNGGGGVLLSGTSNAVVQGNYIGTDVSGTLPLGNDGFGILVGGTGGRIGGLAPGQGNVIAFNGRAGVAVSGFAAIRSNSIFDNNGLGIDLRDDGVTANDAGDVDSGHSNNLQNFPVLTTVESVGSQTAIHGTLDSTPGATFTLQFFANNMTDPSGHGEGQFLLWTRTVTPDAGGAFHLVLPVGVRADQYVTATATDAANNTSEFSAAVGVNNRPQVINAIPDQTAFEDQSFNFTFAPSVFTDPDGDPLTFTATLTDGAPLPGWLAFNAATGTFSGTPGNNDVKVLTVTVSATDPELASASERFNLTVVNTNDAPQLFTTAATLPDIAEDDANSAGVSVSQFLAGLTITDVDAGAVRGIAVTDVDNANGGWQYSTNGGDSWTPFAFPSETGAQLFAASDRNRMRFVPVPNFAGAATFTFRAWDQTLGATGGTTDTSINGGTTSYSTALGTATVRVTEVNDDIEPQTFSASLVHSAAVAVPGQLRTFIATFHDIDPNDAHTATIDWGDGTVEPGVIVETSGPDGMSGTVSYWHTYRTFGNFYVRLTVRDSQGNEVFLNMPIAVATITFQPDPLDAAKTALVVGGVDGVNDVLLFDSAPRGARLTYNGSNAGVFQFNGSIFAFGQGGNDLIRAPSTGNTPVVFFGQIGNDTLVGGRASDILVGGDGHDTLMGYGGRDLLFGGLGADRLYGNGIGLPNGGDGEDVLSSEIASWEYDPVQLASIYNRWNSPTSYTDRVRNLRYAMQPALNNLTVFDDNAIDLLIGGDGLDWFLFFTGEVVEVTDGEEGLGFRLQPTRR
jgi:hypothetical protein